MATGLTSADTTEQILVNPVAGTTARIHTPANSAGVDPTSDQPVEQVAPRPFRCTYLQRQWMRAGQMIGVLTPLAVAIALVTPAYLIAIATTDSLALSAVTNHFTVIGCVTAWMIVTVGVTGLLAPFLSPSFGYRIRRTFLPISVTPDSMHRLFIEMRLMIAAFVGCQLTAAVVGYYYLGSEGPLQLFANWQPVLLGSAIFLVMGVVMLVFGHQAFLHTRGRKIRRWMNQCWRGVALRSFIPAWDNQRRAIFQSCRASRRLAAAYRSIKLGAAGSFAAAGCLAAMSVGDSIVGMAFVAASVVATISIWPTANRIVDWSKSIVDPITGGHDDD
ncbi:hypothetical protein [Planctomycetes bacterium K23_9]|uniref:hypothetical protein n=1 Tax=Stieleria marina TaxID=1930275 RepID=UPI0011A621A0